MVRQSLRFNFDAAKARLADAARGAGVSAASDDGQAAQALVDRVDQIAAILGTPKSLKEIGLPEGQFEQIASDVMSDPQTYWNPRQATAAEVVAWLKTAW
jgi:alcohol dehydrogenase class IV